MEQHEQYITMLNLDLSKELASILMYRWQSIVISGIHAPGLSEFLEAQAEDEIHHALGLADKIHYFGGMPTFELDNPVLVSDPIEILREDVKREEDAIATYKQHIAAFADEPGIQWLLQEFLHDEEDHLTEFRSFLEGAEQQASRMSTNTMPLPSFLQPNTSQPEIVGPEEEAASGVITVIPRVAAFADLIAGRKHTQEAELLLQALTS